MTCSGLYSVREVLMMGPKLGKFWLFMLIFSIIYGCWNTYRKTREHLRKVMSNEGVNERDKDTFFQNDTFDEFLRPSRRMDMVL